MDIEDASFAQYAGLVMFPKGTADLRSTTTCPACFHALTSTTCSFCGLVLTHPAAVELAAVSARTATDLDRRTGLIGRIRFDTTPPAPVVAPAPPTAVSTSGVPSATVAGPAVAAVEAGYLTPPDAPPARHLGVQVILLVVGVSLLAVGAIFFLIYAFITFGLVWRSVIIGGVTIAAIIAASLLKRRKLGSTAEAIAALGVVFVFLDAFAVRANNLFRAGEADGLVYWGVALLIAAVLFYAWHRLTGLRLPSIAAFTIIGPALAVLAAGVTTALEAGTRSFVVFGILALCGLFELAAAHRAERVIVQVLAAVGLVGAGIASLALWKDNDWAPAIGLVIVAAIAALLIAAPAIAHRAIAVPGTTSASAAQGRIAPYVLAGIGAVAASSAVAAAVIRIDQPVLTTIAAPTAATLVAVVLELIARRRSEPAIRGCARVAAWSAAAIAALLTLIPLAASVAPLRELLGRSRWSVPGSASVSLDSTNYAALVSLVLVLVLVFAAWDLSVLLVRRLPALIGAAFVILILAVPLLGMLWLIVAAWLVLAALGVTTLVAGRHWKLVTRLPLAIGAALATLLAFVASWASVDTWWFVSLATLAILIAARYASAAAPVRAILVALAAVVGLYSAGSLGAWVNERFTVFGDESSEVIHFVAAASIVLLGAVAIISRWPAKRGALLLSVAETRVLFWLSFSVAVVTALLSAAVGWDGTVLAWPDFGASVVLAAALLVALLAWSVGGAPRPRIAASMGALFALGWLFQSIGMLVRFRPVVTAIALILAYCAIYVLGRLLPRQPLPGPAAGHLPLKPVVAWVAFGCAVLVALISIEPGIIDPLEWGTAILAVALLIPGIVKLLREPTVRSWPTLAPGLLVLLVPSLLATFVDQPVWRLVGIGVICIVAIIVGVLARLQAPLVIGSVVVLAHALRTFAPQLVAVYQLTEWWVWAVIGGAIILFIALTFERRVRDLRSVGARVGALR